MDRVTRKYMDFFNKLEDEYLRERSADLNDISKRLLRNLIGETAAGTAFLEQPKVLVSAVSLELLYSSKINIKDNKSLQTVIF